MDRQLKFRGWHVTAQKMFSAEEMAADQLTLLTTGQFINVSGSHTKLSTVYPKDKFIPLQFTGLLDAKDVEIYEGDIVKALDSDNKYLSTVEWDERQAAWGFQSIRANGMTYYYNLSAGCSRWEVVGNIFENQALLEK